MIQGKFIVLEGIDGSGKSTQIHSLVQYFEGMGYSQKQSGVNPKDKRLVKTQEPGATPLGSLLSSYVKNSSSYLPKTSPNLELWLFSVARVAHIEEIILPALKQGSLVLCDRFTDSTLAYQHYGKGVKRSIVNQVTYLATDGLTPDLTIVININIDTALTRTKTRGNQDRFDQESRDFFVRVQNGYREIVEKNPLTHVLVDGNLPENEVTQNIIKAIQSKISL